MRSPAPHVSADFIHQICDGVSKGSQQHSRRAELFLAAHSLQFSCLMGRVEAEVAEFALEAMGSSLNQGGIPGIYCFLQAGEKFRSLVEEYLGHFVQELFVASNPLQKFPRIPHCRRIGWA